MKTLIFDLNLKLRWISDHLDATSALRELAGARPIDAVSESLAPDDWNFARVTDAVARDVEEWQSLGAPASINPLMHPEAWRRHKDSTLDDR